MMPLIRPALIVFGGLPGTGKTVVSRAVAERTDAVYLRIDAIEQAIRNFGVQRVGSAGYGVGNAIAGANLMLGHSVVADCVNPVSDSRAAWRETAVTAAVPLVEIELQCSDPVQHRQRVEGRQSDLPGHRCPSWETVSRFGYEPWLGDHLVLDTAVGDQAALVEQAVAYAVSRVSMHETMGYPKA